MIVGEGVAVVDVQDGVDGTEVVVVDFSITGTTTTAPVWTVVALLFPLWLMKLVEKGKQNDSQKNRNRREGKFHNGVDIWVVGKTLEDIVWGWKQKEKSERVRNG